MFGDALKNRINELTSCSISKADSNTFWIKLRDIAVEDIVAVKPQKIDSDTAIALYYSILAANLEKIPNYYRKKLKSNKQERFRVLNRNMWSSNAFHPDGLANQYGVEAYKEINESRKGFRIIYKGV